MNNASIVGRLTHDLELSYTQSNKAVIHFTVAVNRNYKNSDGEYETDFIRCSAYGKIAETTSQYCNKGDMIGINGSIRTGRYQDKDGNTRYITEVSCEKISFLQTKRKEETSESDPFSDFGENVAIDNNFLE